MIIREAAEKDIEGVWQVFHEIVSEGETYPYPVDTTKEEALDLWIKKSHKTFVAEEDDEILGTYYIRENQPGQGSHVCNCGYMVSSKARGRGLATAMCEHSQKIALEFGYKAMQFNLVMATNETAVNLWKRLGFDVIGRLPKVFNSPSSGYVDAFVMYKWLAA